MIVRRFFGILILLTGIFGLVLGVIGLQAANNLIDQLGVALNDTIELTVTNLDNVHETLVVTKSSLREATVAIDTVQITALDLSTTITETRPFLNSVNEVATSSVPTSLDAFQEAIPNIAEVAGGIDDAMTALSNFTFATQLLGVDLGFDLGISYAPAVPFDETITQLGASLEGLPESLRTLDTEIQVTSDNLVVISQDVEKLSADIGNINAQLRRFDPVVDGYIKTVSDLRFSANQARQNIDQQMASLKMGINFIFLWLALMQITPLYLGSKLIFGKKDDVLIP
ncbi:MAG: hypothetical protein IPL78_32495 [Chloroflexi bacterium]|nr:hypothetical protein [Chloroflexota bacterium]